MALVVALGGLLGSLVGAGTESFNVQVASFIGFPLSATNRNHESAMIIVAVNTPTGPHTELLAGNFEVTSYWPSESDPEYGPEIDWNAVQTSFRNLGGGFYRIDLAPRYEWQSRQYVFMVTVHSGRGSGVAVAEFPTQLTQIPSILEYVND